MADATSQLDATLQALQGGLTNAAGAAGSNIQGWITTLQGNQQLAGISSELKKLNDAIGSGDASTISSSLQTLGEHTTKAASSATADSKDKLMKLGQALSSAASQLKG
ncbi:hypothetical protein QMK33_14805 [Hymenobacter sp. H14-R3]|uniref:hypothetical protein n=1 Tax=Hymenobacter sp. H14-R3 TaxID=3046308 RepID=UPI0024B8C828|nr:hypothetical protein [Hymenobacter sp. H14-R3]MDJ0366426.1 hypothetical protein [Hymenobacter sp. H14-R3]